MTTKDGIRPYEATPLDTIPSVCATVRATFNTNKTKDLQWRKVQLRKLYWAVRDYSPQLVAALKKDLNKSEYEAYLSEIDWITDDCNFQLKHLDKFAKDTYLGSPDITLAFKPTRMRLHKEPLGSVLIIGTYNYPLMLLLAPFVGAVAAGCTAVLKPSESAPATAMVIQEMLEARLDPEAFTVVNGTVPETTALLDEKWDKIFYTGSTAVAKIIAKKAAETLTPVTLELGGQNPAFVTRNANVKLAARRMLWSKALNAGQVCLSHNYVLAERSIVDELVKGFNIAFEQFFPNGAENSELSHIINERQFLRIKNMLDKTKGKIVMGGKMDQSKLFMEPTAVLVESADDITVQEESFGPVFAILPVDSLAEGIEIANRIYRTPLASFSFGSDQDHQTVLNQTTSGGTSFNDSFFHACLSTVTFGGVGDSGTGAYRGKASFDCFTHVRPVAHVPSWMETFLRVRYMPYRWSELKRLRLISGGGGSPGFDRDGRVVKGLGYWVRFVLTLGGGGAKGAFFRWCAVVVAAIAAAATARDPGAVRGLTLPSYRLVRTS